MDQATRLVIDWFEQLSRIPRCSKQEDQISRWLHQWATARSLDVKSDPTGNMVIHVPATVGFEGAPTVILQGHMDMVCEKNAGSDHDFTKDPIRLVYDGDWLTARETTLGADNGIGIALALALADHPGVGHPPLEFLFTVDEETGLTGAKKMDPSLLSGRILINLDSEDEGVFVVGCAGGRNTAITLPLEGQPLDAEYTSLAIYAQGMKGGHSGIDIAKHRANANKVLARLLAAGMAKAPFHLMDLKGGTGRNVIPRTCEVLLACRRDQMDTIESAIGSLADTIQKEYLNTDPELKVGLERKGPVTDGRRCLSHADTSNVVNLLTALPSGPVEMTEDFPNTVQTSINLAMVALENDRLVITSSQRSSVPSRLEAVCQTVEAVGRLVNASVHTDTGYPSWPMNRDSGILKRCTTVYRKLFASDPTIQIMHAGLECGVIGTLYPGMDMISLGPTMENPHSPSERLYLPSVGKVWRLMADLFDTFKM